MEINVTPSSSPVSGSFVWNTNGTRCVRKSSIKEVTVHGQMLPIVVKVWVSANDFIVVYHGECKDDAHKIARELGR